MLKKISQGLLMLVRVKSPKTLRMIRKEVEIQLKKGRCFKVVPANKICL